MMSSVQKNAAEGRRAGTAVRAETLNRRANSHVFLRTPPFFFPTLQHAQGMYIVSSRPIPVS